MNGTTYVGSLVQSGFKIPSIQKVQESVFWVSNLLLTKESPSSHLLTSILLESNYDNKYQSYHTNFVVRVLVTINGIVTKITCIFFETTVIISSKLSSIKSHAKNEYQ